MIEIRLATPDDAAEFMRLNVAFNEVTLTQEQAAANLRHAADRVLLAVNDGCVVGLAAVLIEQRVCYVAPYAEVTELYIEPEHRRQGVAQMLMQYAEQMARAAGADELTVCTGFDNTAGQRLYLRLGFENDDVKLAKRLGHSP